MTENDNPQTEESQSAPKSPTPPTSEIPSPPTVKTQSTSKSVSVKKAVTWTAIVTFVATALGQYAVERIADRAVSNVVSNVVPEVAADVVGPYQLDMAVIVPPTTEFKGVIIKAWAGDLAHWWAVNHGGGPADEATADLTVWGTVDRPILLRGIRATNINCQPAPAWEYITPYGGGDVDERTVRIDLDSADPNAVPLPTESGERFEFPLQVSKSEIEYFDIDIVVSDSDCTYELELGYEETLGTVKYLPFGGGPHRVISSARATRNYSWWPVDDNDEGGPLMIKRCPSGC